MHNIKDVFCLIPSSSSSACHIFFQSVKVSGGQGCSVSNTLFFLFFLLLSGDYEAAISEHQQELALSEALNDVIGRAVANRKIGECYAELGNIEAALKVSGPNGGTSSRVYSNSIWISICTVASPTPPASSAPAAPPGSRPLCQRSRRGAKGPGHHWSNVSVPLRIGPIEEQPGAGGGRI